MAAMKRCNSSRGSDSVGSTIKVPATGKLMASPLGYFIRDGKHSMNRQDWEAFLDFADAHLKK
ncbi:MAG TPA: hypothetical protein PLC19_04740 [Marmoricola sp.]|nr:hypothetical protein [Marmoricola sp.]